MNTLLNRLFGLEGLGFGSEGTTLEFARPIAAWGWALIVLGAGAIGWWSYSRLAAPRRARWALASLRVALLVLLVVVLAGPQLSRANERVEKDWLIVLVDRSASMTIPDAPGAGVTRQAQLEAALADAWPRWAELAESRRVLWMGFGGGAFDLASNEARLDLGPADGRRTNIGAAIDAGLARAAARPVCGLVVLSDGRSMDDLSRAARRRLEAEQIPVYAVPLGSPDPIADLAIASVEAPRLAFADDTLPVMVEVDRLGPVDHAEGSAGVVRLIEASTGVLIDEVPLPADDAAWESGRARVVLTTRPREPGSRRFVVRVVPARQDLSDGNNQGEASIEVVDRPLRVAVFDGYPRWESRYLKNLLVREASISGASLILAANRRYLPEGGLELRGVPRSTEDWARFDVVVIGDVRPELFGDDALAALRQTVAERGVGLLWLAGSGATPRAWRDSPLADLLPFTLTGGVEEFDRPVLVSRTPLAERLGLLALGDSLDDPWPASLSDPDAGWSALRWAQRIDPGTVKPTAEVLATARPVDGGEPPTPLLLSMRYGAGRVLFVASDEIWRWRYARGETLPERFWLPLLRMQGRESLSRTGRPAAIGATPRRPLVGQPVRVFVELLDQSLVDQAPASIPVGITSPSDPSLAPITLSLIPEASDSDAGSTRTYAAAWIPDTPGDYRMDPASPLLVGLDLRAAVEVTLPDDELRRPEADHAMLAGLTQFSGGAVFPPERIGEIPSVLPRREVRILAAPEVRTLWDRPIVLAALFLLMTLEWCGRRLIKLA